MFLYSASFMFGFNHKNLVLHSENKSRPLFRVFVSVIRNPQSIVSCRLVSQCARRSLLYVGVPASVVLAAKAAENGVQMEIWDSSNDLELLVGKSNNVLFALEVWNMKSWFQRVAAHARAEAEDHEEIVAFRLRWKSKLRFQEMR